MRVRLDGIPAGLRTHPRFFPLLGYHVGGALGDRVPVLDGVSRAARATDPEAFCAAAASSGALALAHLVGITPEAPTLEGALGGRPPEETVVVTTEHLRGRAGGSRSHRCRASTS